MDRRGFLFESQYRFRAFRVPELESALVGPAILLALFGAASMPGDCLGYDPPSAWLLAGLVTMSFGHGQSLAVLPIVRSEDGPLILDRSRSFEHLLRVGTLGMALCLAGLQLGCESVPIRTLQGARHYSAGSEALRERDAERAIDELEQAAALVPHASEIQNHLGLAYWSAGRMKAARTSFERALELDCENQAAEINLENLMTSVGETKVEGANAVEGNTNGG